MAIQPGTDIGRYHILERLGEGGMAVVYKAYDTRLESEVAVKAIRTGMLPPDALPRIRKRFEIEARKMAQLTHPNIVPVIDYGEFDGSPYIVMRYLPGGTLKDLLNHPMPINQAVEILLPIANALGYAHQKGLVHRDIKPSNILITENGQPMLSDFGVAKVLDVQETQSLTTTGIGVGTPEYMAPEMGIARDFDHRADIYALGIVLYEMVTGRKPFIADTPVAVLLKQSSEPLPHPSQFVPEIPASFERILFKSLAKAPDMRYASMSEFADALRRFRQKDNTTPKVARLKGDNGNGRLRPEEKPGQKDKFVGKESSLNLQWLYLLLVICGLGSIIFAGIKMIDGREIKSSPIAVISDTDTPTHAITPNTLIPTHTPAFTFTPTTPAKNKNLDIGSSMLSELDNMVLMYVPEGEFYMGAASEDKNARKDEFPQHVVYLNAFWIDQTEVTNAQYQKCVETGICKIPSNGGDHLFDQEYKDFPITDIPWKDANTYCRWVGRRLPTEAEWEKAARGTDGRIYPWGNEYPKSNYFENDFLPVGSHPDGSSIYGAMDMAGSVSEWVSDWYQSEYYKSSPTTNPLGPDNGGYHVIRGGSLMDDGYTNIRTSARAHITPWYYYEGIIEGFRCAMDAE